MKEHSNKIIFRAAVLIVIVLLLGVTYTSVLAKTYSVQSIQNSSKDSNLPTVRITVTKNSTTDKNFRVGDVITVYLQATSTQTFNVTQFSDECRSGKYSRGEWYGTSKAYPSSPHSKTMTATSITTNIPYLPSSQWDKPGQSFSYVITAYAISSNGINGPKTTLTLTVLPAK